MADHLLFTPQQVSSTVVAALKNRSTLARLVNQDFSKDFVPGRGASVTVKAPVMIDPARVYTAENRAAGDAITYSNLYEPYRALKLTDQVYNAVQLPDDFATFTLTDMASQVVGPMAESVADGVNQTIVTALKTIKTALSKADAKAADGKLVGLDDKVYADVKALRTAGVGLAAFGSKAESNGFKEADFKATKNEEVLKVIRRAHALMGVRGVPVQNRYLVVGAGWVGGLLSQPNLFKVNEAGDESLLRDATLGKLYGFTVVADYTLDPYEAYAFQRDAITLATRTPVAPRGAAFSSTVAQDGFALRYLHDYDADHLQDRAVVDLFAGASVLDAQRIVKLTGAEGMEEPAAAVAAG